MLLVISCSQSLRTAKPDFLRFLRFRRSLSLFRSILVFQNGRFVLGMWPHFGQPCQKHPSTNTATFSIGKKKSGDPSMPFGCMSQPFTPARTRAIRNGTSVDRLPFPRTARMALERFLGTLTKLPPFSFLFSSLSTSPLTCCLQTSSPTSRALCRTSCESCQTAPSA